MCQLKRALENQHQALLPANSSNGIGQGTYSFYSDRDSIA